VTSRTGVLEILLLGPIEARRDGTELVHVGARQRTLLAVLALNAGQVVSSDRLIDELWGEEPPGTATTALHGLVSQLRKALEPGRTARTASTVILTRPPGYELRVEPGALDLVRFEQLATEGRSLLEQGECSAAADRLREGLGLWRGAALAGTAETPSSSAGALRLEERQARGDRGPCRRRHRARPARKDRPRARRAGRA
jgi:DNA-binding SARP family transcriptional activator